MRDKILTENDSLSLIMNKDDIFFQLANLYKLLTTKRSLHDSL